MEVFYSWRGNKTLQRYNLIFIVNSSAVQADRFNKYKILLPSELHKYVDKYSLSYWYVQHTWLLGFNKAVEWENKQARAFLSADDEIQRLVCVVDHLW